MASHTILPLIYILLKNILHIQINGGDKCLSIDCRFNNTFQVGIFIQIAILPSIDTDQAVIVILFNAACTAASVPACKTDHIAGRRAVRIDPAVLVFKPYAGHTETGLVIVITFSVSSISFFFSLFKLAFLVIWKLPAVFITQIRPFGPLLDQTAKLISIKSEHIHQCLYGWFQIIIRLIHDLTGIKDKIVYFFTGSQIGSVTVYNITPPVRNSPAGILLLSLG